MSENVKDALIKAGFIWLIVTASVTLPSGCIKAAKTFQHQVLDKNPTSNPSR